MGGFALPGRTAYSVGFALLLTVPALSIAQCTFPAAATGRVLTYTLEPALNPTGTILHVQLKFQGGPAGTEEIEIPMHWAGEQLHAVKNLHAVSEDTVIADSAASDTKVLHFPPNDTVIVAYDLVKDWSGPLRHPLQFHPVLMPNYLEITGQNGLVYPKMSGDSPVRIKFTWRRLPTTWVLATSFGTSSGKGDDCQSYAGPYRALLEAVFAAGEFRIHHFKIRHRDAVLAIRDIWTFTDGEAITAIQKAVGAVRDFWHDDHFPYFLVTWKAYDTARGQGDGGAFTNAIWLYMSHEDPISKYLPTIAHEAFHTWNPRRMGSFLDQKNAEIDWFKEGFTTYYAARLLYRAGLLTRTAYVDSVNYDLGLFRNSTSAYIRGRIVALWADAEIQKESAGSASLDNAMFDLVRENGKPFNQERILDTISHRLSLSSQQTLQAAVEHGALPELPRDPLGPCIAMSVDDLPKFDLGFDFSASQGAQMVTGVKEDGPAFQAGLRDGQKLINWSVYNNQPDKMAQFTVEPKSGRQAVGYYPRGNKIKVPQFHVRQGSEGSNRLCN